MNEIVMIPIEQLIHHPENPRLDLGDLTELTASIKANGILQNLTVVFEPEHGMNPEEWTRISAEYDRTRSEKLKAMMASKTIPDRYLVVIGNRRLEASKAAGLKELPCSIREMDHQEQIATMLQENMQRNDLTVYEQAKGIQMMMDLGFSKEQISERTGLSRTTIDRRLAVATLPDAETKEAVGLGYDLMDLVEISKIESEDTQRELLQRSVNREGGLDTAYLRQSIARALNDQERKKIADRLLPDVEKFAKPLSQKDAERIYSSKFEHLYSLDIELKPDAKVKPPKDPDQYLYRLNWNSIEIWRKAKREKHVKSDAEIALEKKQHDAKDLNDRMRENRVAFVSSFTPNKTQETKLKSKMFEYLFTWKSRYSNGDFFTSYHSWAIAKFRQLCGMAQEEGRNAEESLMDEFQRRGIPMGRAILAWMLCGGIKADDRQGYASQYNGDYQKDVDLDDVYTILTDAGYQLSEEEQQWKDGTHPCFGRKKE